MYVMQYRTTRFGHPLSRLGYNTIQGNSNPPHVDVHQAPSSAMEQHHLIFTILCTSYLFRSTAVF